MKDDAKTYGGRYPAYRDDPLGETLRAVASITNDKTYADEYAAFLRDMVYGDVISFETASATLKSRAAHLEKTK
jgi:hypothetical protein